jgi:hypothetical protein
MCPQMFFLKGVEGHMTHMVSHEGFSTNLSLQTFNWMVQCHQQFEML